MLERSPRHRRLVVTVALLAAAAAAGGSASASRPRPPADDALARAVALQVNAAASVVAEARGDQTSTVSGASLTVPGILELRTADSAARTRLGSGLRARAGTDLGHLHLQASTARIDQVIARVLAGAESGVRETLEVACTLRIGVETEPVVAAAVHGAALGAAGTPLATLPPDGSLDAEIRAEVRAVLEAEELGGPACAGGIGRLAGRVVAAVERPVRAALDAHLSVSLTALRTECDLGRRSARASTELVVHRRTAALLGLDGELDGDGVLVRVGPNTGVDLGGGVSVILNQQHRTNRPGREAQITVHGAVVRIDGIVVATLASSHCRLWGDVTIDTGTGGSGLTVAPEVEAGFEAGFDAGFDAGAEADAEVSVASRTGTGSRLASFTAGAYIRATRHF